MELIPSLHIIGSRKGGGAERFFTRLVAALNRAGHPATAVCRPGSWVAENLDGAVPRILLPMPGAWDPVARWRLGRLIRRSGAAVVQTYMGRTTRLVRLPAGRKPVHVARLGGFYDLRQYRHAHAWVGNTGGLERHLRAGGLAPARIFRIGNFVEPAAPDPAGAAQLRRRLGLPAQCQVALCVARLHPYKGIDTLLEAWARFPAAPGGAPARLVIVGDGPLREALQGQARALGQEERVVWAGWQDDPAPWYELADLCVCPSRREMLGNVVLEAWAHRRAVVATRSDGPLELIEPERDGVLVAVDDAAALAAALERMLAMDTGERAALGAAGYRKLLAGHSPEAVVAAYLALYRNLLAEVRP
ncbi:MAG: glycosyltransferase [Gammaproteobacteria bacterium]|nr:glycosyltransferase [Gammaproteobacteria bacterium]